MDKRRKFSREFKLAAVKKVMEQGLCGTAGLVISVCETALLNALAKVASCT